MKVKEVECNLIILQKSLVVCWHTTRCWGDGTDNVREPPAILQTISSWFNLFLSILPLCNNYNLICCFGVCVCVCLFWSYTPFLFCFSFCFTLIFLCTLVSTILYEFDAFISLTHYIADLRWKLRYCFCNLWLVASDVTRHSPIGSIKKSLMSPLLSAKLWLGDILNMRAGSEVMAAKVVSVVYVGIFSKSIVVRQIQA